jgi:hypothetical protein
MTTVLTLLILTCAVIISLFDKLVEYFSPNGTLAQISQEASIVINTLDESNVPHESIEQ